VRFPYWVIALAVLAHGEMRAADEVLAFQRGPDIFVTNLAGEKPRKLVSGDWPNVSPDGTKISCNTQHGDTPERHIAIVDISSKAITVLQGIPSDNCHSPVWSPDGKRLVFQIFSEGDWHLGLIDVDGTKFRFLHKAGSGTRSYWGAVWAPDGKSLYCQDMDAILQIDLNGRILKKWPVADLTANKGGFSSGSSLAVSPDSSSILFDADMDEEVTRKDWEGPPPAIWKLDLASGKATRITPPEIYAWHPCWVSPTEFLFNSPSRNNVDPRLIQRWSLTDGKSSLVVKDASAPSLSTVTHP
jgi:TolB protein